MIDDDLKSKLKKWEIDNPDEELANKIVAKSVMLPQEVPFSVKFERFMDDMFGNWQTGLAYKFASLTICALIGLGAGWNQNIEEDVDIFELAFELPEEGDEL